MNSFQNLQFLILVRGLQSYDRLKILKYERRLDNIYKKKQNLIKLVI